jgi:hypothetical protein
MAIAIPAASAEAARGARPADPDASGAGRTALIQPPAAERVLMLDPNRRSRAYVAGGLRSEIHIVPPVR